MPDELSNAAPQEVERAILGLVSDVSAAPGADVAPAASAVESPAPPVPPAVGTPARRRTYLYPQGVKIHPKHKAALDAGADPETLEHIKHGFWPNKGCQCLQCKTKRNEVLIEDISSSPGAAPLAVADPLLSELLTEDFCGMLLDVPNRAMELRTRTIKAPPDVVKIWKTDADEIAQYGKFGKRLADHYLALPDFKHKELALFVVWYLSMFGMKAATMRSLMPPPEGETK